ncbi:MAG: MarR family transcriptional regulator [Bacteroidota bacterium]
MPTIEQLIKQSKFSDEKHKAVISLTYSAGLLSGFWEEFFGRFNLTSQQYNVLRILRGQHPNPASVFMIRERMMDKMSDASRLVERLRKAGFVERSVRKDDRRAVDVIITEKGLDVLQMIDSLEEKDHKPTKYLTDEEAVKLSELLGKVINALAD